MVSRFKRLETEGALNSRIAVLSARRAAAVEPPTAEPSPPSLATAVEVPTDLPREERLLAAKEQLIARLSAEVRPERRSLLSRGELAKVVDAAVQAHLVRHGIDVNPLDRRDLVTSIIAGLLNPGKAEVSADGTGPRRSNRAAIDAAKAHIQPLVLEHMDVAAAAEMPRAMFEAQLSGWVKDLLTESKIQLNFIEQRELVESLIADMLGLGPLEPLIEDETVTDIMVNGAKQVYVERRGKLELTDVAFPRRRPRHERRDEDRHPDRPPYRRIATARRRPSRRRQPRQHHHPAAGDRRAGHLDPQILEEDDHARYDGPAGQHLAADGDLPEDRRAMPAQHPDLRRHRLGQDDTAERAVADDRSGRAHRDDRGRRRTAAAAAACRAAGDPPAQPRGHRRDHDARPAAQRAAHAARPDHPRRDPRRRGARHAAGDEHRLTTAR